MSIASSSASSVSVSFKGREVDLETALDETVRDLQKHLNMVQCHLRTLAADCERDPDFKEAIATADALEENIDEMAWLFTDLRGFCYDMVGIPETADEKAWLKQHKVERKAYFIKKTADKKAQIKAKKQQSKENKMMDD